MELDRNGLQVLDREECLGLLTTARLGRVGLTVDALPTILPVNFRLVDGELCFRTAPGTKLAAATANTVVAFEVDDLDPVDHTGWSVVVTGLARRLSPAEAADVEASTPVARWAPGPDAATVGISLELVTGRRLMRPPSDVGSIRRDPC